MVVRKSSMPYPASPPPPPSPPEPFQQSHLQVDSADVPPVRPNAHRSQASQGFEEMGNPWQDDYSPRNDPPKHEIPNLLRPGNSNPASQPSTSMQNLPDVLRPGWSGEATPRSSLDSDRDRSPEREWWEDDDVEEDKDMGTDGDASKRLPKQLHVVNDTPSVPAAQVNAVKRKPLPGSHSPNSGGISPLPPAQLHEPDFASNNPFRRPSETFIHPAADEPGWGSEPKEKQREEHPHPLRSSPSTDQFGKPTLSEGLHEKETVPPTPSFPPPPPPSQAPPPVPGLQEPLVPQPSGSQLNPWTGQQRIPSPSSFAPSQRNMTVSTDDLLDRGDHEGSVSLGDELKAIPNHATAPIPSPPSEVSLLEDDEVRPQKPPRPMRSESDDLYAPPLGPPPSHTRAPVKPPRPAVVTSEQDLAKMKEQRNETYQIKHFNWYDMRTSRMRRSSMLTQNKNGPCPLLALVNALILGATEDMQAALDDALRLREQVSLGLIIETLMDELLSRAAMVEGLQLPDVDELNRFLMRLRTGMNANPRFVPATESAPNLMDADSPATPTARQTQSTAGTFESTQDIKLYSSFKVKLVHGWLPHPNDEAAKAFARSAPTYEDAQAVQFGEEELEYKLSSGGLTQHEQQVWEDITSIKQFLQAYPTQLTQHGLQSVQHTLAPGEFAILFRNDHFSTIYKHPRDQRLYTLITDAGYADRDEIIWETLEDINGARSEFFAGDFSSVSHGDTAHSIPHSQTDAANPGRVSTQANSMLSPNDDRRIAQTLTSQEQQEQADMDFALALQMQEEEEQAQRRARAQQQQGQPGGGRGRGGGPLMPQRPQGRRSQGNIPIPLGNNPGGERRPIIPPRNQQNRNPAVNRPADAEDPDAPPAYEEAARQSAYVPPIGSPLHPSSTSDLPLGRTTSSTSNIHAQGQTTGTTGGGRYWDREPRPGGLQQRRRTSAYGENSEHWGQNSPDYSAGAFGPSYAFMTPTGADPRRRTSDGRREERDCNVM